MGFGLILFQSCSKEEVKDTEDFTYGAVKDVDGNVYKTITIDLSSGGSKGSEAAKAETQTWMAENLKTTKYSNGDLIGTTDPATKDIWKKELMPKYQWAYEGNEENAQIYGRLYTWYTVDDIRNICPTGWHVPTNEEWTSLIDYLGGYWYAGGKVKEAGTTHWESPNTGATNAIGFTALPGGARWSEGSTFASLGIQAFFWTATLSRADYIYPEEGWTFAFFCDLGSQTRNFRIGGESRADTGYSVRCIKDN